MSDKKAKALEGVDPVLLGKRIDARIAELDLAYAEVGRRVGSNDSVIHKWINGKGVISLGKFATLCRVLKISADALLAPATPEELAAAPEADSALDALVTLYIERHGNKDASEQQIAATKAKLREVLASTDAPNAATPAEQQQSPAPRTSRPPPGPKRRRGRPGSRTA